MCFYSIPICLCCINNDPGIFSNQTAALRGGAEFKQVSRFMTESELSGTSKPYQSLFPFLEGRVLVTARQSKRCKSEKFCLIIVSLSLLSCRFLRTMKKRINYIVIPGGITKVPDSLLLVGLYI